SAANVARFLNVIILDSPECLILPPYMSGPTRERHALMSRARAQAAPTGSAESVLRIKRQEVWAGVVAQSHPAWRRCAGSRCSGAQARAAGLHVSNLGSSLPYTLPLRGNLSRNRAGVRFPDNTACRPCPLRRRPCHLASPRRSPSPSRAEPAERE